MKSTDRGRRAGFVGELCASLAALRFKISSCPFDSGFFASVRCPPLFRYISGRIMSTFYDRFLQCVGRWPENVAVEIQRRELVESYTYAELRRMAESVGRWITETGFEPGARLAILADNHPRWGAAYLGTIAAGCTAVPLDTAFHAEQVAKLLRDSGASLLFVECKTREGEQAAIPATKVRLVPPT